MKNFLLLLAIAFPAIAQLTPPYVGSYEVTTRKNPVMYINDVGITNLPFSGGGVPYPAANFTNRIYIDVVTTDCGFMPVQRLQVHLTTVHVDMSLVQSNAFDVRMWDSDGFTPIPFYVSTFNSSNLTVNFVLQNLEGSATRRVWLDYGNSAALTNVMQTNAVLCYLPAITNGTAARWLMTNGSGTLATDSGGAVRDGGPLRLLSGSFVSSGGPGSQGAPSEIPYAHLNLGGYMFSSNGTFQCDAVPAESVNLWVRFNSLDNTTTNFIFTKYHTNGLGMDLRVHLGHFAMKGRTNLVITTLDPVTNQWYNIIGVWDYRGETLYVNGLLVKFQSEFLTACPPMEPYTSQRAVIFNGDGRGASVVTNTISADYGQIEIDYNDPWIPDALYSFYRVGRPPATLPDQKLVRHGAITNSSPSLTSSRDVISTLLRSYDSRYAMIYKVGGTSIFLAESEQADCCFQNYGQVLPDSAIHGMAIDDGNGIPYPYTSFGNLYYFMLNNDLDLIYKASQDGGRSWSDWTTNATGVQFAGTNGSGTQGSISITAFKDGPLAGQYGLLAVAQTNGSTTSGAGPMKYCIWAGLSYYITGPYTLVNSGLPVALNPKGSTSIGSPTYASYYNGEYRIIYHAGPYTPAVDPVKYNTPILGVSARTSDWINWVVDNPVMMTVQDQNIALDQVLDFSLSSDNGIVSLYYTAGDSFFGQNVSARPNSGRACWATFKGSVGSLLNQGFVRYEPQLRFGFSPLGGLPR